MDSTSSSVIILLYRSTPAGQRNLLVYRHSQNVLTMWTSLSSTPFYPSPTLFTNTDKTDKILVQMVLAIHKHQRSCKITKSQMAHECSGTCTSSVSRIQNHCSKKKYMHRDNTALGMWNFYKLTHTKETPELKVLSQLHWGEKRLKSLYL